VISVVVILNAVLAIPVVVGLVSLLGGAIVADAAAVAPRSERQQRPMHTRTVRFPATASGAALDLSTE
jgi:hypothetical protein